MYNGRKAARSRKQAITVPEFIGGVRHGARERGVEGAQSRGANRSIGARRRHENAISWAKPIQYRRHFPFRLPAPLTSPVNTAAPELELREAADKNAQALDKDGHSPGRSAMHSHEEWLERDLSAAYPTTPPKLTSEFPAPTARQERLS